MSHVVILGAGSFGTALAHVATQAGHIVTLWARTPREGATTSISCVAEADRVLLVTPAQTTRAMLEAIKPHLTVPLLICSKGLEQDTGKRLDEVAHDILPTHSVALLSGPSFHDEIMADKPVAVTIAGVDAEAWCAALATPTFRPYAQGDVAGVALAGALKNPLAIGAGIIAGADLGESARAAFITRGLAEITRLAVACGAKPQTLMGLSGIGDVFLTCSSAHSRNYRYGWALSRNEPLPTETVEGLPTIAAARMLAAQRSIEMPIMNALYALCYEHQPLMVVLQLLLARPLRSET